MKDTQIASLASLCALALALPVHAQETSRQDDILVEGQVLEEPETIREAVPSLRRFPWKAGRNR